MMRNMIHGSDPLKNGPLEEDLDVFNLIIKLSQEKLLLRDEKNKIQELNELVRSKTRKIIQTVWITTKQRLILYERESTLENCRKFDLLSKSEFINAKQALGFQNTIKIGNLLQTLRSQPNQLAKWLNVGEQITDDTQLYLSVLNTIVVGLYGSFIFSEDTKYMLALLYELAKLQLLDCDDPRRIIKQRVCSFKHLYFLFHEVLQSAKFFLSSSMEIPIIQMMSCTDFFLDVDPDKTCMRFKQNDNDVTTFFEHLEEYRKTVIRKLVEFTNTFITSLLENVYGFPKAISWIVYKVSKIIEKSFSAKQANSVVVELIFTLYICPVIVNPEQYGICISQVNEITRHNLIQVGQILQWLALSRFEAVDPKFSDLFDQLDKTRVVNFMELLFFDMDNIDPPVDLSPIVTNDVMLFTELELNNLISFLQRISLNNNQEHIMKGGLIEEQLSSLTLSSRNNSPKANRPTNDENPLKLSNLFSLGSKNQVDSEDYKNCIILEFLIDQNHYEPIGMLPEEKVIDLTIPLKSNNIFAPISKNVDLTETPQNGDIKQPFNFQDEGSIGNTSDNLEAISEAASNHSVDSSIELENEDQNDNLSDMVSANVSGRGTPNISGRDTPSSQVCENEDRILAEARQVDVVQPQPNLTRQIRSEIDDKFCKFEIKKLLEGDETISIISETWSTDVLASDNETVDAGDNRHERPNLQLMDQAVQEVPNILDISETQSEGAWSTDVMASDTERLTEVDNEDSISVAQSDDTNSVARSDDTRSETELNICSSRRLSTSSNNSYVNNVPNSTNQNYIASVTTSNVSTNPFLSNGMINNMNYLSNLSSGGISANTKKFITSSNFQEYRKIDMRNDHISGKVYQTEQMDGNANTVFRSVTLSNSEHLLTVSENNETKSSIFKTSAVVINSKLPTSPLKDVELNNMAGPSGLTKRSTSLGETETEFLKQSQVKEHSNEILLSNCSLNSSSSGSSSHSFENKNSNNENSEQWGSKQWLNSSGSSLNVTLTPSESTSELSVLSNNYNNTNGIKKSSTLLNRSLKPSVSTGAIPKSISFDMTADKGLEDDNRSKRGGFFGKLRIGFKNRRGKSFRNQDDFKLETDEFSSKRISELPSKINNAEVSEDILAKYRPKPFVDNPTTKENCDLRKSPKSRIVENSNNEELNSFNDIKNKLRLVLSNTTEIPFYVKNNPISIKNKIEMMLRLELGKARRLREWSDVARISEAIRCVNLLNDNSCLKLLNSLKDDMILRSTYIQYLATSKQELLFSENYLARLMDQILHDKDQCEKYLATISVREFLSEQEVAIREFCDEFKQLSLADEKCDLLQNFYKKIYAVMNSSPNWRNVFYNREKAIKITIERFIMTKTYKNSIYPNGDGDRDRDRVLHHHIEKLSKIITPYHKDLSIHKMYLRECPWLPAQDALRAMNACRTPRDKIKCIVHCAKCIMDLLSLSQNSGSTTADDFTPVLVYVIIKVNPEALLSTIQYINSFFQNQITGEEEYWWTQFCAAVEYIKTMDYSD